MAFFQIEYSSDVLGQYRQVDVIYPDRDQIAETESDTDIPVLYLLHGMGGNHNSWAFRTNIQRLLRKTNLIVIMPNSEMDGIQIPNTVLSITMPLQRSFLKSCNVSSQV